MLNSNPVYGSITNKYFSGYRYKFDNSSMVAGEYFNSYYGTYMYPYQQCGNLFYMLNSNQQ